MNLDVYYDMVQIDMLEDSELSRRVKSQLDQVVTKIPDEEPFRINGTVYIGRTNDLAKILLELYVELHGQEHTHIVVRDGNFLMDMREDPGETTFCLTLNLDHLERMTDMAIRGLIVFKLSQVLLYLELIYGDLREYARLGREEREIRVEQNRSRAANMNDEQIRSMVDAEAKRLGLLSELLSYDIPDSVQ